MTTRLTDAGMAALGGGLIAITYGLARFVFGLFLPAIRDDMAIRPEIAGLIAALPFLTFVLAVLVSPVLTLRIGVRAVGALAALLALAGLLTIAGAEEGWMLALGVSVCGISTGLSSPAMAEAVHLVARPEFRGRVNATVNAGTSLGIAVAMIAVLIWAEAWRPAYMAFAALAGAGALAAIVFLPAGRLPAPVGPVRSADPEARRRIARLSALAVVTGGVSAAFWVFAPDAAVNAGEGDGVRTGLMWLAVGLAGLAGGSAGDLIARLGAGRAHGLALGTMSLSVAALMIAPGSPALALLCSALFGAAYMTLSGFYLVRGAEILAERPAWGPVLPLLATSSGQVAGAALAGVLIGAAGYGAAFAAFGAVGLAAAFASERLVGERPG